MAKKLRNYGGSGFDYASEDGLFKVVATETKQFNKLSEAKAYYESLNEQKAIWDLTKLPELLDAFTY
jgi:hypothetical protein